MSNRFFTIISDNHSRAALSSALHSQESQNRFKDVSQSMKSTRRALCHWTDTVGSRSLSQSRKNFPWNRRL